VPGPTRGGSSATSRRPPSITSALARNSLAQIAVGQGKTRQGLYDAITSAAFKRVDEAQSAGKLTADQAKAAKDRIAIEVNTFIDRKPGATTNGGRPAIGNLPTVKRPTTGTP